MADGGMSELEDQFFDIPAEQLEKEELLGESLTDNAYLRNEREFGMRALQLVQGKGNIRQKQAERRLQRMATNQEQLAHKHAGALLRNEFQLSRTRLECLHFKRRAAVLQLKLDSSAEDNQQLKRASSIIVKRLHELSKAMDETGQLNKNLKVELQICRDQLAEQQRLTEVAEAQVASSIASAGKTKADLQAELNKAITETSSLKHKLDQAEEKCVVAVQRQSELQEAAQKTQEALQAQLTIAEANVVKAEMASQAQAQLITDKAQATENHLRELLAMQQKERGATESLWKSRVSDLQSQIDQLKKSNDSLSSQVVASQAELARARLPPALPPMGRIPEDDEADEAMGNVSDLVNLMYDPSPQPSPEKVEPNKSVHQRPAGSHPVPGKEQAESENAAAILERISNAIPQKAAKPRQTKKGLPVARKQDVFDLEESPQKQRPNRPAKNDDDKAKAQPVASSLEPVQTDAALHKKLQPKASKKADGEGKADKPGNAQRQAPAKKEQAAQVDSNAGKEEENSQEQLKTKAAAVGSDFQETNPPLVGLAAGRPQRQRRQTQPFWIATNTAVDTPATLSPTPSAPDPDDTNDPSFTFPQPPVSNAVPVEDGGLALESDSRAEAADFRDDTARLPDHGHADPAENAEKGDTKQDCDTGKGPASSAEELKGRKRPFGRLQGKARGKKSRLGPHGQQKSPAVPHDDGALPANAPNANQIPEAVGPVADKPEEAQEDAAVLDTTNPDQIATNVEASDGVAAKDESNEAQAGVPRRSGRPVGISKIDLRTVWGSKTPMPGAEISGAENSAPAALNKAAEGPIQDSKKEDSAAQEKGIPVEPQPGSKLEANPLAALNPSVVEAAKSRLQAAPAHAKPPSKMMPPPPPGTRRSQLAKPNGAKQPTHKRKLQPSSFLTEDLTRDLLLAPVGGFKIPKLKKPADR